MQKKGGGGKAAVDEREDMKAHAKREEVTFMRRCAMARLTNKSDRNSGLCAETATARVK